MKGTVVASEAIPTGKYPVQVVDVQDAEGTYGPQVKLSLEVIGESAYAGKQVFAWAAASLSTKCKLARWAKAMGYPFEVGKDFDTDVLQGAQGTATILRKSRDNGDGDYDHVENIEPLDTDPFARE